MNNIGNSQIPNTVNRQQSAPVAQKTADGQKATFSGSAVPKQVSPLVQQLVQFAKETKSQEHAEHLVDFGLDADEDFLSELIDNAEGATEDEKMEAGQRDGRQEQSQQEEQSEEPEIPQLSTALPVSVSGGGVTVGLQPSFGDVKLSPIPDDRIIALSGQHYYVAFLKRQVGNFASSSFANAVPDVDGGHVPASMPWGGAILTGSANQFEAYINASFPNGDPSVPANPAVKYEGGSLLVNGQAYGVNLTEPKLVGSMDSFLISYSSAQQAEVQRVLHDFNEVKIVNELSQGVGDSSYLVSVPADYYSQWQAALTDNLPAGVGVKFPSMPYGGGFI